MLRQGGCTVTGTTDGFVQLCVHIVKKENEAPVATQFNFIYNEYKPSWPLTLWCICLNDCNDRCCHFAELLMSS